MPRTWKSQPAAGKAGGFRGVRTPSNAMTASDVVMENIVQWEQEDPGLQRPRHDRRFPPPGVKVVASYGWNTLQRGGLFTEVAHVVHASLTTTRTLHSQRAEPSPLWCRLVPWKSVLDSGLARIPRVLSGKAQCGAVPPVGPASPGAACAPHGRGRMVVGATPIFLASLMRHGAGAGYSGLYSSFCPAPGGRSHHRDPWREGHRALPRSGPVNRSVHPSTPAGQVAGPVIHEPTAAVEQVRPPAGCLDPAADVEVPLVCGGAGAVDGVGKRRG